MNGIKEVMQELIKQRKAIEEALLSLEKVFGAGETTSVKLPPPSTKTEPPAKAARKGGLTPAGRKRLSEHMKQIWAAKRTGGQAKKKSASSKKAS
jgi:hypothetical protein